MTLVANDVKIKYDRLYLIPFGGQSEIGGALWAASCNGKILLIDAGVSYPSANLPGVDLLLPNTNFLAANTEHILALVLTNGQEEHCGAVPYLLDHLKIPRIMAPKFVASLLSQRLANKYSDTTIDTIETRHLYQMDVFELEWIQVNDAIADACALKINTPCGTVIYTSSFKLDQTPIDKRQMDIARLAELGDQGVSLLISDSSGVENQFYTPSEKIVAHGFERHLSTARGRVIVVLPGSNTLRLQVLFDLAAKLKRKVILYGETLIQTGVAAVVTGNLSYDRELEGSLADLPKLKNNETLVIATGEDDDAMTLLHELAYNKRKDLLLQKGDTVIFSSEIYPGESRKMAMILDQFMSLGIHHAISTKDKVHVSNHAGREELKLVMSITKPRYFIPALGEGRHIMHHCQLAQDFGIASDHIFPLKNGDIFEITNNSATTIGAVEAQPVYYNRGQAESITSFSVNERHNLSMEGVLNLGLVLSPTQELMQEPTLEGVALGFLGTREWHELKIELQEQIKECLTKQRQNTPDLSNLKTLLRDLVFKTIRSRLGAKPTVIVIIHELPASYAAPATKQP